MYDSDISDKKKCSEIRYSNGSDSIILTASIRSHYTLASP